MNKIILTLIVLFSTVVISFSQDVPKFAKYAISTSGCYAYFPADPGEFDMLKSEDSLNMYIGEASFGNAFYSIIVVDLGTTYASSTKEDLEFMMVSYLDYLQGQLSITGAAGYGMGHTLESNPDAVGIIDFWEDAELYQYDVKAWADKHYMAVLMVYSLEEINYNYKSLFLNGFRFPE